MNIFALPQLLLSDESTEVLAENGNVRIERIVSAVQAEFGAV